MITYFVTMALILHIETATSVCSAALSKNGNLVSLRETEDPRSHASSLSPFIEDIFNKSEFEISDLDAISISIGPGSYTGLRIGVSTVKGLAYGSGIPVISVSTLQSLANRVINEHKRDLENIWVDDIVLCPMIDARRMEVYSAFYSSTLDMVRDVKADIIEKNSYKDFLKKGRVVFFGNGSEKCKEMITHKNAFFIDNVVPSATFMIQLAELSWGKGDFVNTAYFEPFYLKDFIATVARNKVLPPSKTT